MATIRTYRWDFDGLTTIHTDKQLNSPTMRLSKIEYDAENYVAHLDMIAWESGSAHREGWRVSYPMGLSDDDDNESLSTADLAAIVEAVYPNANRTFPTP